MSYNAIIAASIVFMMTSLITGCYVGKKAENLMRPSGVPMRLMLYEAVQIDELGAEPSRRLEVELLDLGEEGMLGAIGNHIVRVDYSAMSAVNVQKYTIRFYGKESYAVIRNRLLEYDGGRLKLLSRFPQGVSPELLDALLAAHDQEMLVTIP